MPKTDPELGISSNNNPRCCRCGILITRDTDSGWEVFVAPLVTQPICVGCNLLEYKELRKAPDPPPDQKKLS